MIFSRFLQSALLPSLALGLNYYSAIPSDDCPCVPGGGCCEIVPGKGLPYSRAYGAFSDDVSTDGWGKLYIHSEPSTQVVGDDGSFAAGYLEGFLTSQQISDHYLSWYDYQFGGGTPQENPPSEALVEFMMTQYNFTLTNIANARKTDDYWTTINAIMQTVEGILAGQQDGAADGAYVMSLLDMLLLQAAGDLYDIVPAVSDSMTGAARDTSKRPKWREVKDAARFEELRHRVVSCSAFVKVDPTGQDIYAAHTTWTSYQNMLRVYKHYEVGPNLRRVGFSSKPGMVYSKDDFHVLPSPSQKLVVIETTNGILNDDLYKLIVPQSLLTWQRVAVANRLASGGQDWTEIHSRYNSGTYNNQYFVVDMKLFTPGEPTPTENLLWISEQLPGMIARQDVSAFVAATGGWPSYNVPYDKTIYEVSGYQAAYDEYGDAYSYSECSRAKIFARDLPNVATFNDTLKLIRYNEFQTDPICDEDYEVDNTDPSCALAWRGDLSPTKPGAKGAIDGKATAWSYVIPDESGTAAAQSGPTHDDQVPFSWAQYPNAVYLGQPYTFDFDWVTVAFDSY